MGTETNNQDSKQLEANNSSQETICSVNSLEKNYSPDSDFPQSIVTFADHWYKRNPAFSFFSPKYTNGLFCEFMDHISDSAEESTKDNEIKNVSDSSFFSHSNEKRDPSASLLEILQTPRLTSR